MRSSRVGLVVVVSVLFVSLAVAQEPNVRMNEIQQAIRDAEYHVGWQDQTVLPDLDAAWHATNRAQNLRFYFTEDGLRVVDRTAKDSSEILRLKLLSLTASVISPVSAVPDGNKLTLHRGQETESYVNTIRGLEHQLTVTEDHTGERKPMIEISWSAAAIEAHDRHLDFKAASGRRSVLRIVGARDAAGVSAEAIFTVARDAVRITFPGTNTVFPVTVKTLLSATADTILEGNSLDRLFGSEVAAGDVNGDGYADAVAGVAGWDNGQAEEGAVMVFHGGPGGIASNGSGPIGPAANTVIETNLAHLLYWPGSLAIVGDVNGDGYDDLAVGYSVWDPASPSSPSNLNGAVWLFHGSAGGISANSLADADAFIESAVLGAQFGYSLEAAGDVNGDGYADVIVGSVTWHDDPSQTGEGAAFVFHGSGLGVTAISLDQADSVIEGNEQGLWTSDAVAGLGDVNGDGFDDVAVSMPFLSHPEFQEGGVAILYGSSTGIDDNPILSLAAGADTLIEGNSAVGGLVTADVAGAGDVDGDGFDDVILGSAFWGDSPANISEGVVVVYHGSPSGIDPNPTGSFVDIADSVIEGNPSPHTQRHLGNSVAAAGDVNGDGFSDVVVGGEFDNPEVDEGAQFVFFGSSDGVLTSRVEPVENVAIVVIEGDQAYQYLGSGPPAGGDFNGDGFSDLLVGLPQYDLPEQNEGIVRIYHGGADTLAQEADAHHDFSVAGATFGSAASNAGDLNGDGFSDFVVGAPFHDVVFSEEGSAHVFYGSTDPSLSGPDWSFGGQYQGGRAGVGVASAGDLNGDGYGDLAVGTSGASNPEIDEGRVDVFYGSVGGLPSSPDWYFESNLEYTGVGMAVSTAGDIDGDGYGDLIVGAPSYSNGQSSEGRAYVFFGSSMGLPSNPGWTYESDEADANLGFSVASAGDVNGDGFSDVIVGAFAYTSGELYEGAAYGFYGSENGLPAVPNWFIQTNRVGAHYGMSVAGIGDVNGDGFSDVIVGAPYDTNGEIQEGRAYIYHGSAGGLSTIADQVLEENIANASFGVDVAAAGDVNGDGFSDVMVGSPYTAIPGSLDGRASLYLGTAAGVGNDPGWLIGSTGTGDLLGYSAAGAGDVNGDGFSDVVVGSPYSDSGAAAGGSIGLYFGNGGAGRPVLARQFRGGDDPAPVQPWGLTHSGDAFEVSMTATSPRGRELVKMHVEACPTGEVWGDLDCRHVVSADWTAIPLGENGVVLTEAVSGLTEDVLYHWRAHVLYVPLHADEPGITTPPVPRHGPWRTLSARAAAADIRVGEPQRITIEMVGALSSVGEAVPQAQVDIVMTTSDGEVSEIDSSVDFDTFNLTAIAGEDFVHTSFNRFFPAGTADGTAQSITVDLINDDLDESDEEFAVELYDPVGALVGGQAVHTVTILDDDPPPELSALDVDLLEGAGPVTVTLELSAQTSFEVTVEFATADGSATEPLDYVPVSGTALIPPMDTVTTVVIPIEDDWLEEPPEFFILELSNPANASLVTSSVTVTIVDNDAGFLFADGFESGLTSAWSSSVALR